MTKEDTKKVNIQRAKDCGVDLLVAPWHPVFHGDHVNDNHTTLAEKAEARERNVDRRIPR